MQNHPGFTFCASFLKLRTVDVLCNTERRSAMVSANHERLDVIALRQSQNSAPTLVVRDCFAAISFNYCISIMNPNTQTTLQDIATPSGATRRPRKEEEWQRVRAKKLRNLGQEYVSRNSHKRVQARQVRKMIT